jgi:hypothetical protein
MRNDSDHQRYVPDERPMPKREIMQVHVEYDGGDTDSSKLKRFRLDGRCIEVVENLDRWFGRDYAYFKVSGDDGNLYILRLDEAREAWELTMFQRRSAQSVANAEGARGPQGDGQE